MWIGLFLARYRALLLASSSRDPKISKTRESTIHSIRCQHYQSTLNLSLKSLSFWKEKIWKTKNENNMGVSPADVAGASVCRRSCAQLRSGHWRQLWSLLCYSHCLTNHLLFDSFTSFYLDDAFQMIHALIIVARNCSYPWVSQQWLWKIGRVSFGFHRKTILDPAATFILKKSATQ